MNHSKKYLAALMVLVLAPVAVAQLSRLEGFDVPGSNGTQFYAINDAGDIAGHFRDEKMMWRGFKLSGGQITKIDFPGASQTMLYGIAANGDVGGTYYDSANKQHGFLMMGGTFKTIDYPGADQTMVYGINSRGDATGMYFAPGNPKHFGWALIGARFYTIDHPLPNDMSCGSWINDNGEVGGHVQEKSGAYHGYVWKDGKFTLIEIQGGNIWQFWDSVNGINAEGDILGTRSDARGKQQGFLLRKGVFTTFDVPGSQRTRAWGMNRSGQVVGMYVDSGGVNHGFVTRITAPSRSPILTVDDDGVECPGALRTIQEAVAQAPPGAVIQVCPGIYGRTVRIVGPEKTGLQLVANGRAGEVILQGDYAERDGFHLENVTNVTIRGFTVRDFGNKATTATDWGTGYQIYLENAHYNTIENNRLINGDMAGIWLSDSSNNTIQQNEAFVDNPNLANCGIHIAGAKSAGNTLQLNVTSGNKMAGIMISGGGPGNRILDNTVVANGRAGIQVSGTSEIWIEGNRASYNRGPWGTSPYAAELVGVGVGISLTNVNKATVFDNRMRGNTGTDLTWDGKGENKIEANACETSTPAGACRQ